MVKGTQELLTLPFSDEKEKDEDNEATEETGDGKAFSYEINYQYGSQ